MSWLNTDRTESTTKENIWLKFAPLTSVDEHSDFHIRILGGDPNTPGEPASTWQHWFENRPFNCPGMNDCPVCRVREVMRKVDPDGAKKKYQMTFKYLFNVLVLENNKPVVRILSFGRAIGKRLKTFTEEYGDLRDYDIQVRKTKVGNRPQDVEYDAFWRGNKNIFSEEVLMSAREQLHELSQFVAPASQSDLEAVARGELPNQTSEGNVVQVVNTADLLVQLEDIAAKRSFSLSDLQVGPQTDPSRIKELIDLLDK